MKARHVFLRMIVLITVASACSEALAFTYTDKLNRSIEIPTPVRRAVFFQLYEMIPALDIWDNVAGLSRYAYRNDLMKAARPHIEVMPTAGSSMDVKIEALLKLKPDLVISWNREPKVIRFMEEKGLRVVAVYPESLSELYDVMDMLGVIFARKEKARGAVAEMEKLFSIIRDRTAMLAGSKKKALWLGGKQTSVFCGVGVVNDLFQMIGAFNVTGHIPRKNAEVSLEQIVVWNPDVIFIWGNAGYTARDILRNRQWRFIKAVKEGRVYKAPRWSTWSPRIATVALWMAIRTYPEYYRGIDLDTLTDAFYQNVFAVPYTDVQKFEK